MRGPEYAEVMKLNEQEVMHLWNVFGGKIDSHAAMKSEVVKAYAGAFGIRTLIETGTFLGMMIWATIDAFDRIYSIELGEALHRVAARHFAPYPHVTLLHGDSGKVLPNLLAGIAQPCVFWLDSHYSGPNTVKGDSETPVLEELAAILRHPVEEHVVLIDDARLFTGVDPYHPGYPNIGQLRELVRAHRPGWTLEIRDDIIRIHGAGVGR
jgi:hypothetical protein